MNIFLKSILKLKEKLFLFCFFLFFSIFLFSQQFSLLGNAVKTGANSYRITSAQTNQSGMMTNFYALDLTQNFSLTFQLNFGNRDANGADGFAFVLSKVCNPPLINGGGLGAEGIGNSIIVEFDTFQNGDLNQDYYFDHLGIYKDGLISRSSGAIMDLNSNQAVRCGAGDNVEDGLWHNVEMKWVYVSNTIQKLEVYFDGVLKQSSTQNHISNRFLGQTKVFWSITAATGALFNLQQVTVPGLSNELSFNCNTSFTLAAPEFGSNYVWSPSPISSNGNKADYIALNNQTITCNYIDFCGAPQTVSFVIDPIKVTPTFTFQNEYCHGDTVAVLPSTSDNGWSGVWSPSVINNTTSGTYRFTPTIACAEPVDVSVVIKPKPITSNITLN